MNRLSLVSSAVLLVGLMGAPGAAFGDVEIVDFDALMQACVSLVPDLDPATADNNDNGMLDATEFAVLSSVFADTGHSFHDTIHEAYKTNWAQAQTDLGSLVEFVKPELKYVLGAYATLGDGSYTRSPETFEGSWGVVAQKIYEMVVFGSEWNSGAPNELLYDRQPLYAGPCGDFDGDGVFNIREFHGQGGDRALYVAGVLDPLTTTDGGDPLGICGAAGPNAQFTADMTYGCVPLDVDFTDLSSAGSNPPIIDWSWDFDGDSIEDYNGQNPPTQTYATADVYTVSLTVSTATESDTETKTDYIDAAAARVDFDADTSTVCVDTAVNFIDLTNDCGSAITGWEWDFDDDGTVDDHAQHPSHAYDVPGVYDVRLTVTNALGSASVIKPALVAVTGPDADFEADITSGIPPLTVTFTDLTTDCVSAITDWSWDFDFNVNPGEDYNGQNPPPFTYNAPALYTVKLTVSTAAWSNTETKTGYIGADGIIRVDRDSTHPSPDGTTWARAFPEIQQGIDAAYAKGGGDVWVAQGYYSEDRSGTDSDGALLLREGVHVYAGFMYGDDEFSDRDWEHQWTILEGIVARGGSPAYHCVKGADNATLDGFTIIGGRANGGSDDNHGAGMYNSSASPTVANCTFGDFDDNVADGNGGGMYNYNASPVVTNCGFEGNQAANGGGMANHNHSQPVLTDCRFGDNDATAHGGGVYNDDSEPQLVNTDFEQNVASGNGGGMHSENSTVTVNGGDFFYNWAESGGSLAGGGGIYNLTTSIEITGTDFSENHAENSMDGGGGAIFNVNSTPVVSECTFASNVAINGAGVLNMSSSPTVTDCVFSLNWAYGTLTEIGGGGIANADCPSGSITGCTFTENYGEIAGMANTNCSPSVSDCTFNQNDEWGIVNESSSPTITQCTFSNNWGGMRNIASSTPQVTGCTFSANHRSSNGGGMLNETGSAPMISDCMFIENTADFGGAIYSQGATLVLRKCKFWANEASSGGGGAICNDASNMDIANSIFLANKAHWGDGTALFTYNSPFSMANCSLADNGTEPWDATITHEDNTKGISTIVNSILWANMRDEIRVFSGVLDVTYSNVEGGYAGTGNMDQDPLFVDAADGDLRLQLGSPCADTGDPAGVPPAPPEDMLGTLRPQNGRVDMGAFETGPPIANFHAIDVSGCAPCAVQFINDSLSGFSPITTWEWDFDGDGSPDSFDESPAPYTYTAPGTYRVSLTVGDGTWTDTKTRTDYITVLGPTADFTVNETSGRVPMTVQFTDETDACGTPVIQWEWDFDNDGTIDSYDAAPTHVYTEPGVYSVSLTVTTAYGTDSVTKTNLIAARGIVYVDKNQLSNPEDGLSWATAFTEVQPGIDAASPIPAGCDVWVADGLYDEVRPDADGSIVLADDVHLYGGFDGGETQFSARDWDAYPAILDGSHARNGGTEAAYHVVKATGVDSAVLDGFTVTGGLANGVNDDEDDGGGLYLISSSITLRNCHVRNNENIDVVFNPPDYGLGAGVHIWDNPETVIENCVFEQNVGTDAGPGALYIYGESNVRVTGCRFSENSAAGAGAAQVYPDGGYSVSFDDCVFTDNYGEERIGAVSSGGSGLAAYSKCLFTGNHTDSTGTANTGGGAFFVSAPDGYGPTLANCVFWNNSSNSQGGAIYHRRGTSSLVNCTFNGNSAGSDGGAIFNCDYSSNEVSLVNCILWGDVGDELFNDGSGTISVQYSDVEGGYAGTGNIGADPIADAPDFVAPLIGDLRLSPGSPCINAGDPAGVPPAPPEDILGQPRPSGGRVDMGAYEQDDTPPTALFTLLTGSPTGADAVDFEVAFDEPVTPTFDAGDVSVTGDLAGVVGVSGADPTYTVTVTLDDADTDGTVGITVAGGGAVTDLAGNPYAGGSSPLCEVFNWHGFVSGPENTQAYTGDTVTFTVVPDCGASTLLYQWKWDDGAKTIHDVGDDSPTCAIPDVTGLAGDYWCEVTYDGQTHLSAVGALDVADPIEITQQPAGANKYVGESHAFSIVATGGFGTLHYEWLHDGYTVGDDSPLLEIVSLTLADAGAYTCEVNDEGPAPPLVSDEAALGVTVGAPAAGLVGLGMLAAVCAVGAIAVLRKHR